MKKKEIKVYSDGGARGNPGPAAVGIVVYKNNKLLFRKGKFIGRRTNNQAEYEAVVWGFELLCKLMDKEEIDRIIWRLDSLLVVKQLNLQYKIKNRELFRIFVRILKLKEKLGVSVLFRHIPRKANRQADLLVNQALDSRENT